MTLIILSLVNCASKNIIRMKYCLGVYLQMKVTKLKSMLCYKMIIKWTVLYYKNVIKMSIIIVFLIVIIFL